MAMAKHVDISIPFDQETILDVKHCELHELLDKLREITGMTHRSQCFDLILDVRTQRYITRELVSEDISRLSDLEKRLREELAMVYFVLDESNEITRIVDKRIKCETRWRSDSLAKFSSEIMEINRRIVWLTYELDRCQQRILEHAQSGQIYYVDGDRNDSLVEIMSTCSPPSNATVHSRPLIRPHLNDCKPNISFETFTLVREFVFNQTNNPDPAIRFRLMEDLEEQQMDLLLTNPYDFFFDIVRCMGMSAQEFNNACFKHNKAGNPTGTTRCPCGVQLGVTHRGVHNHSHCCVFSEWVKNRCPSILQDSWYRSTYNERVMGSKETAYIVDVIKKRLPKEEWKKTFLREDAGKSTFAYVLPFANKCT